MKISDREKKIIVIIVILAVIALPFIFVIRPFNEKQKAIDITITELENRYAQLLELNENRDDYIREIAEYNKKRDDIIAGYAEGIRQENIIMFLRGLELKIPVFMKTVSFTGNIVTPISAGYTQEDGTVTGAIDAVKTQTTVAYNCKYSEIKTFLKEIMENSDRMVISVVDIKYDSATGKMEGLFVLDQFAITGEGRVLEDATIPSMEHGNECIFGTYISDPKVREALEQQNEQEEE